MTVRMIVLNSNLKKFEQRKREHIELALLEQNQCIDADIDHLILIHEALPDIDFCDIDIQICSLNKAWATPFFISSMTAGHTDSININQVLAEAAAEQGWAMGVGSQRRELSDEKAKKEWQDIRKSNPKVKLYGNIGIAQLITHSVSEIISLCDNLQAEALFVHCNPLQECIQPEGTPNFAGCYNAISKLCQELTIPVIIKETGCGFSKNTLKKLKQCNIAAVDVSGLGGTHWGRIEGARTNSPIQKNTANAFKHWGISTLQSLFNAQSIQPNYECWASGGIRSGLDAAKFLAIGANRIGIAKPMLESALKGTQNVIDCMQSFEYELKTALFCTGSKNINQLRESNRWQLKI